MLFGGGGGGGGGRLRCSNHDDAVGVHRALEIIHSKAKSGKIVTSLDYIFTM